MNGTIGRRIPGPAGHDRRILGYPCPVVVFDLVVDIGHGPYGARRPADLCAEPLAFANNRINSRTSFGVNSEKISAIQVSCSAAMRRNSARPSLVRRITWTRRSESDVRRSR